jgi:hypothetical protein
MQDRQFLFHCLSLPLFISIFTPTSVSSLLTPLSIHFGRGLGRSRGLKRRVNVSLSLYLYKRASWAFTIFVLATNPHHRSAFSSFGKLDLFPDLEGPFAKTSLSIPHLRLVSQFWTPRESHCHLLCLRLRRLEIGELLIPSPPLP